MAMANCIKEKRLLKGLTQEQLADKLGLQKSAIAKYENGRVENIKRSTISKMADVLECSPAYLMGWESEKQILSGADAEIIKKYHRLSNANKQVVLNLIDSLLTAQSML